MIPAVIVLGAALLGAVVASCATTLALRATDETGPRGARSLCDGCLRPLQWNELLPIVSFVALRGRCRTCASPISPFHPMGEIAGLATGVGVALAAPDGRAPILALMAAILLAASVIDARLRILPDLMTTAVAVLGGSLAALRGFGALIEGLASGVISLVVLAGIAFVYRHQRGEIGLGMGDVKLFAALALWLGLATPWMVFVAAVLGLVVAVVRRTGDRKIPLGPMIATSGFAIGLLLEAGLWPGP